MSEDYFYFKQFKIKHNKSVMKVGTDGVLIGAYVVFARTEFTSSAKLKPQILRYSRFRISHLRKVNSLDSETSKALSLKFSYQRLGNREFSSRHYVNCDNCEDILDVGTGTGLISIMLAQRSNAMIDAIDISPEAVNLARENVNNCEWKNRINVFECDYKFYKSQKRYDLIISNPPYFSTDIIAPNPQRALARHNNELSIQDFINKTIELLKFDGKVYVIYPVEQSNQFEQYALESGLYKFDELFIKPNYDKDVVRIIRGYSKMQSALTTRTISIEKYRRHDYTKEYREITGGFYLQTLKDKS